jgi:hypothetical protein
MPVRRLPNAIWQMAKSAGQRARAALPSRAKGRAHRNPRRGRFRCAYACASMIAARRATGMPLLRSLGSPQCDCAIRKRAANGQRYSGRSSVVGPKRANNQSGWRGDGGGPENGLHAGRGICSVSGQRAPATAGSSRSPLPSELEGAYSLNTVCNLFPLYTEVKHKSRKCLTRGRQGWPVLRRPSDGCGASCLAVAKRRARRPHRTPRGLQGSPTETKRSLDDASATVRAATHIAPGGYDAPLVLLARGW